LGTLLTDWTDIDAATHELARCLGVLPAHATIADAKWVYWSSNPLGTELVAMLERLTALGFLEKRDEPDQQYRIAPHFQSSLGVEQVWRTSAPPSLRSDPDGTPRSALVRDPEGNRVEPTARGTGGRRP
jgi:hypothetical protein